MIAAMMAVALLPQQAEEAEEIVVRAKRPQCSVRIAEDILRDRDFRKRRAEWQRGTPVRVLVPARSGYMCLANIAFRLKEGGVRLVHFDDGRGPDANN